MMPWFLVLVLAFTLAPFSRERTPVPAPLGAEPLAAILPEAYGSVTPGPQVLLLTSQGPIRIVLFPEAAPRYVIHFLREVRMGTFTGEEFGRVQPGMYLQLGGPDTDYDTGGGSHAYELMNTGFDHNALPQVAGSVVMDRGLTEERAVRTRYAIVTGEAGYYPGTVVGHVVEGLAVARALTERDTLRYATRWLGEP